MFVSKKDATPAFKAFYPVWLQLYSHIASRGGKEMSTKTEQNFKVNEASAVEF